MNTQIISPTPPQLPEWDSQKILAWQKTLPTIKKILGATHHHAADDVHQDTFIQASKSLDKYDPARGSFTQWITGVAKNTANGYFRKTESTDKLDTKTLAESMVENSHLHYKTPDISDEVIFKVDTLNRVSRVLRVVELSFEQKLYERSIALIRDYDGNFAQAADRLGVAVPALRESHRQMMELAQVIDRALEIHAERERESIDAPVTVRDIINCFPDPSSGEMDRAWMRVVPAAVMASGTFAISRAELVQRVSEMTGYSPVTARHTIARCEKLCLVARTVLESGLSLCQEDSQA